MDEETAQELMVAVGENTDVLSSLADAINQAVVSQAKISEDLMSRIDTLGEELNDVSQQLSLTVQALRDLESSE